MRIGFEFSSDQIQSIDETESYGDNDRIATSM